MYELPWDRPGFFYLLHIHGSYLISSMGGKIRIKVAMYCKCGLNCITRFLRFLIQLREVGFWTNEISQWAALLSVTRQELNALNWQNVLLLIIFHGHNYSGWNLCFTEEKYCSFYVIMVGSAPALLFKTCWVLGSGVLPFSILPLREVEEG